jgi:hypothetical protein
MLCRTFNILKHSGDYMHYLICILTKPCFMLRVIIIMKGDYYPKQYYPINLHNGNTVCLLQGEK